MLYKNICPNCGGVISEERLKAGLPCRRCLPDKLVGSKENWEWGEVRELLERESKVKGLVALYLLEDELREFEGFFKKVTGGKTLWSIQRSWAKRILSGESFALIAPTGIGKSTLLQIYSLFKAVKGFSILYLVPTKELMNQVISNLSSYGVSGVRIVSNKEVKEGLGSLKNTIVVTTHAFLFRNKDFLQKSRFDVVIVDDFDALLKSSSLIDLVLESMGVRKEAIEVARNIVNLKSEIMYNKYVGKEDRVIELASKLFENQLKLSELMNVPLGQLLIASATGRARGSRVKVLRELLGFEVGSIMDYLRNVVEVKHSLRAVDLAKLLKRLEGKTLVFVSKDMGLKKARELVSELKERGVKAAIATSRKSLKLLKNGEADVLVGIATYYGVLTRGIDEPKLIYNTVFYGIPKFELPLDNLLTNPFFIANLITFLGSRGLIEVTEDEKNLVRRLVRLSPTKARVLKYVLQGRLEAEEGTHIHELYLKIISVRPKLVKAVKKVIREKGKLVVNSIILRDRGGKIIAQIPDVMTYIQASGRCSRLFRGSMTLGLSIILYEDEDLLQIFETRLRNYIHSYSPKNLDEVNLSELKRLQKLSRSERKRGGGIPDVERVKSVLMVVESPTKARTIASMFGRPGRRYLGEYVAYETVVSLGSEVLVVTLAPTLGHIYDLTTEDGLHGVLISREGLKPTFTTIKRCRECGHQFTEERSECPRCGSVRIRDSIKVVNALRKLALESDLVILATDPDDEGEKISYDVYLTLRPYLRKFKRVEFHEITRNALIRALSNPREIDLNRVSAQIVRRVDDRLVGFELSNVLQTGFGKRWLGGGRVQTPVLNWVVTRYKEYLKRRGYAVLITLPGGLKLKVFTKDREVSQKILESSEKSVKVLVKGLETREVNPLPPYTTDSLLTDATRVLKLSPKKVMRLAQDLFELGLITYHRTDSTHVSSRGIEVAKEYLVKTNLMHLFSPRRWGSEGTHECIRPTRPEVNVDYLGDFIGNYSHLTWYHKILYEMIFRRFVASQMKPARVVYALVDFIVADGIRVTKEVPVSVVESGFTSVRQLRLYPEFSKLGEMTLKPENVNVRRASEIPLYTSSDIVRLMKEKEIGRPSTYAKAVDNNLRHGYIIMSKKYQYLVPTKLGVEVVEYVRARYPDLLTEEATRNLEVLLDMVRKGALGRDYALVYLLSEVARIRVEDIITKTEAQVEVAST